MNKVLLYINNVLISLDIPPLVKTSNRKKEQISKKRHKNLSQDNIK